MLIPLSFHWYPLPVDAERSVESPAQKAAGVDGLMRQPVAGGTIVIVSSVVDEQPLMSVTVSVTTYVPAVVHAWLVFWIAEVAASPKFHDQVNAGPALIG